MVYSRGWSTRPKFANQYEAKQSAAVHGWMSAGMSYSFSQTLNLSLHFLPIRPTTLLSQ